MSIEPILKEFRSNAESLYGDTLKDIVLYGSWARNTATDQSDIDVAVVLKGDVNHGKEIDRMIDVVTEINLNYDVLLSVYPVSESNFDSVNSPLLINIRKEGVSA